MRNLNGLFLLLKKGEKFCATIGENPFLKVFEENKVINKLEELQNKTKKLIIFEKISEIFDYFYEEKSLIYETDEKEKN